MRVLVTGSTSFVGRHLILALLEDGHEVVASGRDRTCPEWLHASVAWRPMSIADNRIDAFDYCERPDSLIHLAWQGLPDYWSSVHLTQVPSHVAFVRSLLAGGLNHLVGIGTCMEYGMREGCLQEEADPIGPVLPYAQGKSTARTAFESLCDDAGACFQWLRLFYLSGAGQRQGALLSQLSRALDAGDRGFPMSAGDQVRDFLDVTVAARMISAIIGQRAVVGIINCSSGVPRTVLEVVDSIVAERERDIELDVGVHPYPRGEPMRAWGDTAKQRAALAGSHMRIGREGAV